MKDEDRNNHVAPSTSEAIRGAAEEIAGLSYARHREEKIAQYAAILSRWFGKGEIDTPAHVVRCVHSVPEGLTCVVCGPIRNDDPPTPASPSPAEPLDTNNAARWAETYAAGIESQNEVTEPTRIENWSDFHAGQVYAAKQIAAALRTSVGEESK